MHVSFDLHHYPPVECCEFGAAELDPHYSRTKVTVGWASVTAKHSCIIPVRFLASTGYSFLDPIGDPAFNPPKSGCCANTSAVHSECWAPWPGTRTRRKGFVYPLGASALLTQRRLPEACA